MSAECRKFSAYIDSGAIESVVPKNELPEFDVKPSVGSRRGQEYVTAKMAIICNEGEQTVEALTDGYKPVRVKYQVAEMTKALCSAGQMCNQGIVLVFTSTGGYIHHQATKNNTPFAR